MAVYLTCSHCGCEFLATKQQQYRRRTLGGTEAKFYCSAICRAAGTGQTRAARNLAFNLKKRYPGVCATCGKTFESVYPRRKFCSVRCCVSNPKWRAHVRKNAAKASAAAVLKITGHNLMPRVEITCLSCGIKQMRVHSERTRRFCNPRCYRQYMSKRFDRWIAAPQTIALPQGYDEFLTQNELPCLIEGCDWVGQRLGNHVNFTHGISATEFKRAAGFNLHSGLCTPATSEMLASLPHTQDNPFGDAVGNRGWLLVPPIRNYASLEGREHMQKARALTAASPAPTPIRICQGCGRDFRPSPLAYMAKFCTFKCRGQWYVKNRRAYKVWLTCHQCSKNFQGSLYQQLRSERGLPVFCSHSCNARWVNSRRRPPMRIPVGE